MPEKLIKEGIAMASWQRFIAAVRFKEIDRIPVALWCTARCFASLSKMAVFDFIHDPNKMMEAESYAFKRFPEVTFLPGVIPDYGDVIFIPSALGCKIYWSENSLPFVNGPVIKQDSDIDAMKIPDPHHDGYLPWYLKTLGLFLKKKEEFGDNFHFVKSLGPGELAAHLWGVQNFLINIRLKPDLVKKLLSKVTDIITTWLDAQLEVNRSADGFLLSDDIAALMGKEAYMKFLYPIHCKIRKKYSDLIMLFHCDTRADHLLKSFASIGIDIFHLGPTTDIRNTKEQIGDRVALMGNIDPVAVLQNGRVKDVKEASEKCLRVATRKGGYILSAGGGVNSGTPSENINAMVETSKYYNYDNHSLTLSHSKSKPVFSGI